MITRTGRLTDPLQPLLLALALLLLSHTNVEAQRRRDRTPTAAEQQTAAEQVQVYQLTGIVFDDSTERPVPFAFLRINQSRRRATANEDGFFSIPVVITDTVYFTSLGYHPVRVVVRDIVLENQAQQRELAAQGKRDNSPGYNLYILQPMREDRIELPTVNIYPYNTPSEIRTAMLNMPSGETEAIRAARRNLSPEQLSALVVTLPVDEEERATAAQQAYYMQYRQQTITPTAPIFDPVAVVRLIDYLSTKSRKTRDRKTYNYWPEGN